MDHSSPPISAQDPAARQSRGFFVLSLIIALFGLIASSPSPAARINDLDVDSATYIGGPGDDEAGGVDVAADGTLLFGGSWPGHTPGGASSTDVLGGGDGGVLRLSADGRQVLEIARLGSAILDLEVAADGRVAVAADGLGLVLLSADLSGADWHDPLADPARVSSGGVGASLRVAVLTAGKTVRVFDGGGTLQGQRAFGDSVVADVAVARDGQTVVVTGYNNRTTGGGAPVQIPFIRAFDETMTTQLWRAYDWTTSQLVSDQGSSLADSRGVRIAFGEDGELYFAGRTDGGNNTYRYDSLIVDRLLSSDELISYDSFSNTAGISGAFAITVFGRFDPATGDVLKLQYLLARLSSGNGNSVAPAAIDADAAGRVFVGGQAFARIENRDVQQLSGQTVGPYQGGEAFLLVVDPDFEEREVWTVFTDANGSQGSSSVTGIGVRSNRVVWSASIGNGTARMLRQEALQDVRDAGESTYLATRSWALFEDGFESGDTSAWSVVNSP